MRALVLLALAALAAPAAALAQETPPTAAGPFLFLQQEEEAVVLASMAERRATDLGAGTTTIVFLRDGEQLVRGEALTEADCARGLRRTGPIFIQYVPDPDTRTAPIAAAPPIDWSPPGPLDGPLMDYLCQDGRHDPAQVSPKASILVARWLEGS
ncbi:hypothetical protein [Brevundimonas sp.]|jgi:hypothetical protein|uniref:hypothetical protein n=1 Tax=Brevundimonas sp. TaxID=1871086 RepID=UPI002E13427A|nr:hypothetical protein [Brevundimonas sp.]